MLYFFRHPPLTYLGLSVGKFVDESSNQNSTILNFFKTAQKVDDRSCNAKTNQNENDLVDEYMERHEEESDVNENSVQKQLVDSTGKQEITKEDINKHENEIPSLKNSFFLRYLKQKATGNTVVTSSRLSSTDNSDDDMFENYEKSDNVRRKNPTDLISDQKIISNSKVNTCKVSALGTDSVSENVRILNFGASTSRVDSETNELSVSLSEIFPDLDEVDDGVVELLPSPMQKKLKARIEDRRKHNNNNNNGKLQKHINRRKKTGKYVTDTKDSDSSNYRTSDRHMSNQAVITGNSGTRISYVNCDSPNVELSNDQKQSRNSENEQTNITCINSKTNVQNEEIIREDHRIPMYYEKENNSLPEPHQKSGVSNQNKHQILKSVNETKMRKEGSIREVSDSIVIDNDVSKSTNSTEGSVDDNIIEKCSECGRMILLSEFLEHSDFHAAEFLHKQLNGTPQLAAPQKLPTVETPAKRKRGRPNKKITGVVADKKLRSITAYFTTKR